MAKKKASKNNASKKKPRVRKPPKTYPLELTESQRNALCHGIRLPRTVVERLQTLPEGQAAQFTRPELVQLSDELNAETVFATNPYQEELRAVHTILERLFDQLDYDPTRRRRPDQPAEVLLQFKITLLDVKPPVWRRIQINDGTLEELHLFIQAAMGWKNYHLHQFEIGGRAYGPPEDEDDEFGYGLDAEDESEVRLTELVPASGRPVRWLYEYDFGDGWRHEILFEGYPPQEQGQKYPVCLTGGRACPPEDVGGPWGYVDLLEKNARKRRFDPEAFDAAKATRRMQKVL